MEIKIPHNWTPESHQLPVLQSKERFKVVIWHRKAHKTTLAINELIRWASTVRGTYWYIFPYYNQAKKTVWLDPEMLAKYCPPSIWEKRNNSELYIPFPNGSILYVMGADNPDSLRGANPRGVILDEYGDMKDEIWSAILQPIMTANQDAWCWFVGTPKGQNDLWRKFQYSNSGDNLGWFSSFLPASKSGIISKEALEEAKGTTTQAFYSQEYECEFLENAGSFFHRIRENVWGGTFTNYGDTYQLGVDLAKYKDWTVLTPFCLNSFKAGSQDRFNQIDWNLQKAKIEATARRFNESRVIIDSTGVGDPIVEDLQRAGLNLESFKFTEVSRRQLLDNLAIQLEQDNIKIPDDEGLIGELQSMRFELGERGKIKVNVPEGMTDDRIMSLALSIWGATRPIINKEQEQVRLYSTSYS